MAKHKHHIVYYQRQIQELQQVITDDPTIHPDMKQAFHKVASDLREGLQLVIDQEQRRIQEWAAVLRGKHYPKE